MPEDRQRQLELAMARGESVLLDGDDQIITDTPNQEIEPEKKVEVPVVIVKTETEQEPEPVAPRSSLKYIPVAKYTTEKNEWKTEKEALAAQVSELQAKYDAAAEDGKKFSGMEMKEYFTKFNIPENQQAAVTEMLALAAKQNKVPDEVTTQLSTMQSKLAEYEDEKRFDSDWRGFATDFVKNYPNATYAQLEQAKEAMDILSHHEDKYLDKEFDYIAFREKPIFDEIFQALVKKGFESRSFNADAAHESAPTKLDIENMSPQQVMEYEQRLDEETRKWNSEIRTDANGNQLI